MRYYDLSLFITTPDDVDGDTVLDKILDVIEANGWSTGGGLYEADECGDPLTEETARYNG